MNNNRKRSDYWRIVRESVKPRYNYDILKKGGKHIKNTNKQSRRDGKKEIANDEGDTSE